MSDGSDRRIYACQECGRKVEQAELPMCPTVCTDGRWGLRCPACNAPHALVADSESAGPIKIEIGFDLLSDALEALRLAPVWTLLHTEFTDDIAEDFRPEKWEGYERETASEQYAVYKRLLAAVTEALDTRDATGGD